PFAVSATELGRKGSRKLSKYSEPQQTVFDGAGNFLRPVRKITPRRSFSEHRAKESHVRSASQSGKAGGRRTSPLRIRKSGAGARPDPPSRNATAAFCNALLAFPE